MCRLRNQCLLLLLGAAAATRTFVGGLRSRAGPSESPSALGWSVANASAFDASSALEIEALGRDAASAVAETAARHARRARARPAAAGGKVLHIVYSDSAFYTTRVRWIAETWGAALGPDLVVVADRAPDAEASRAMGGATVHATACKKGSHEVGMCCKLAEAAMLAKALTEQHGEYEWVFLSDDDVYLRPGALSEFLQREKPTGDRGVVLGHFACVDKAGKCDHGLCGGGGYAASSLAMKTLVGPDPAAFMADQMRQCTRCSQWADLALSMVMHERGLELRDLPGSYGNSLTKACLDKVLAAKEEPFLFHYMKTEHQMQFLHSLLSQAGPAPAAAADPRRCATFRSRTWCAASGDAAELPWLPSPDTTCRR